MPAMNKRLITHIDNFLYHSSGEPLQQMVYIIAKLSLISVPAGWAVKRPGNAENCVFNSHDEAVSFLNKNGGRDDYIIPLFAAVKVDMSAGELSHLLLTPQSYEDE